MLQVVDELTDFSSMLRAIALNTTLQTFHQASIENFLVPGRIFARKKDDVRAFVFLWNLRINRSVQPNSNARSVSFNCREKHCEFYLSFHSSSSPPCWKVSRYTAHTCSVDLTVTQRGLLSIDIVHILNALEPSVVLSSLSCKEVITMINKYHLAPVNQSGRAYMDSLARRVLMKAKEVNATEAPHAEPLSPQLPASEYSGLSEFKRRFELADPDNRLDILTTEDVFSDNIYLCSLAVIGPVLRMCRSQQCTHQFDADGSFFKTESRKSRMSGRCKAIVYSDANGQIYPLIVSHDTQPESIASWRTIFDLLFQIVPAAKTSKGGLGSDRNGGLMKQLKSSCELFGYGKLDPSLTLPIESDGEQEWEVERILDYKSDLYQVLWTGGEQTWEPEENLTNCSELIQEFQASHPNQPSSSSSSTPSSQSSSSASVSTPSSFSPSSSSSSLSTSSSPSSSSSTSAPTSPSAIVEDSSYESDGETTNSPLDLYPSHLDGSRESLSYPGWVACLQHIQNNVRHYKRRKSRAEKERAVQAIRDIAYSRTVSGATFRLNRLKCTDPDLFRFIERIDPSLWIMVCWRPGRHYARTSNAVESFWSAADLARHQKNIASFYHHIYSWTYMLIRERFVRASSYQSAITPFAERWIFSKSAEVNDSSFQIISHSGPNGVAIEATLKDAWGRMFVTNIEKRTCSCSLRKIYYLPCQHVIALAAKNGMLEYPQLLVDPLYLTVAWQKCLAAAVDGIAPLNFTTTDLSESNTFEIPPCATPVPTRKRTKRISRSLTGPQTPKSIVYNINDFVALHSSPASTPNLDNSAISDDQTETLLSNRNNLHSDNSSSISDDFALSNNPFPFSIIANLGSDNQRPESDNDLPISDNDLPISDNGLLISDNGLPISDNELPISEGSPLPSNDLLNSDNQFICSSNNLLMSDDHIETLNERSVIETNFNNAEVAPAVSNTGDADYPQEPSPSIPTDTILISGVPSSSPASSVQSYCFVCFKRYRRSYKKWALCTSMIHRKCTLHTQKPCDCESPVQHSPPGRRVVEPEQRPNARGLSQPRTKRKKSRGERW